MSDNTQQIEFVYGGTTTDEFNERYKDLKPGLNIMENGKPVQEPEQAQEPEPESN
ncbi:hypothetical protein FBU59_004386 [Linderina macrospora]|uniref:Uncharacterized protein n=1 Tax=Linderina macrospora TaxID=4868 RepID=A0ACC1J5X1_9FUNG|nr:hypothetical protein FBU59_004386 [Linderina macrospora]